MGLGSLRGIRVGREEAGLVDDLLLGVARGAGEGRGGSCLLGTNLIVSRVSRGVDAVRGDGLAAAGRRRAMHFSTMLSAILAKGAVSMVAPRAVATAVATPMAISFPKSRRRDRGRRGASVERGLPCTTGERTSGGGGGWATGGGGE